MAETGGITYANVSSFGVSDTGLSLYRTPDPLPLPIAARDYPFQPIPLTEYALAPYKLNVPGVDSYGLLTNYIYINPTDPDQFYPHDSPWSDRTQSWFYQPGSGEVVRDADIAAANAKIIAAYHLAGRQDLIQSALETKQISSGTLERVPEVLPSIYQAQQQRAIDIQYQRAYDVLDKKMSALTVKNALPMFAAIAFSMIPGVAPFAMAAYAAYTLGTTIPRQVKTGRVTVGEVIGEVGAVAGLAGAGSQIGSAISNASTVATTAETVSATGQYLEPVALSGNRLQLSTAAAIGQPIDYAAGDSPLVSSLFGTKIAPAFTQAARLGLTVDALNAPGFVAQATQAAIRNPLKTVGIAVAGGTAIDRLLHGDIIGALNVGIAELGIPGSGIPNTPVIPPAPRAPLLAFNSGGQGGSGMLFSSPSDPASANPWPWVIGAGLLGLLLFVIRKG